MHTARFLTLSRITRGGGGVVTCEDWRVYLRSCLITLREGRPPCKQTDTCENITFPQLPVGGNYNGCREIIHGVIFMIIFNGNINQWKIYEKHKAQFCTKYFGTKGKMAKSLKIHNHSNTLREKVFSVLRHK